MLQDGDKPDRPLSDMIKRLLARLFPYRGEAQLAPSGEDERKRQALLVQRRRLRSSWRQRLGK